MVLIRERYSEVVPDSEIDQVEYSVPLGMAVAPGPLKRDGAVL
jgi:hypothetical protein